MKSLRIILVFILLLTLIVFNACPQPPEQTVEDREIKEPPTLLSPDNGAEVGSNQVISFSWSSVAKATSYIITYGSETVEQTGTSLTINISEAGYDVGDTINWHVEAVGPVNKLSSDPRAFSIFDNEPPVIENLTFTSPTTEFDGTFVFNNSGSTSFTATITDNVAVNSGSLTSDVLQPNGTSLGITVTDNLAATSLSGGFNRDGTFVNGNTYTLVISVADDRGNTAEEVIQFAIDTENPSPAAAITSYATGTFTDTDIPNLEYISDSFTLTGTAEDNVKVKKVDIIFTDSVPTEHFFTANGQENWTADISGLDEDTYTIEVYVEDVVGNNDRFLIDVYGVSDNVIVDYTAPDINVIDETIYTDHNTQSTAWTLANILGTGVIDENGYSIYTGLDISETQDYQSGSDVTYVGGAGDYSEVDIEICEPTDNTNPKDVLIEIGIDGIFESAFAITTTATTCTIGSSYNADVGPTGGNNIEEYYINLTDFPKGTGSVIADGQHTIVYRATDEAGNSTDVEYDFYTQLINRPMLDWPDDGGNVAWGTTEFQWFHPDIEADLTADIGRTAHSDYVSAYYLDMSLTAPTAGNPAPFETDMVSKRMIENGASPGLDDYGVRGAGEFDIQSENFDISADPDLGTGVYYYRIRAVIENNAGEVVYEIGSDGLPRDTTASDHIQQNYYIHRITVGDIHPPTLTSPGWGEYFGTNESISIEWNDPTTGGVIEGDIDGYQLQMRTISPQGADGSWVDILGDASGANSSASDVNNHSVNVANTPIDNSFALYQFRVRTCDFSHTPKNSGWAYGYFVYTPEDFTFDQHLGEVATGIPFKVSDMDMTSDGKIVIASSEDRRIWILDAFGKVETSVKVDYGSPINLVTIDKDNTPNNIYLYLDDGSIIRLDENYEKDSFTFTSGQLSNVVDFVYNDGFLYAIDFNGTADTEKLYQISTVLNNSYVEIGDLAGLTDLDSNPKVAGPTHLAIDPDNYFVIMDDANMLTRVTDTGAYVQEADLSGTFTNAITDMEINGYEVLIADGSGVTYLVGLDGVIASPTGGFDEGDANHNIDKVTLNSSNIFVMAKDTGNSERLYSFNIDSGALVAAWSYNGYLQAGGSWSANTIVGLPGPIAVRDNITTGYDDGYPIYGPTENNSIFVADLASQQVVDVISGNRSSRFDNLSGIAVNPYNADSSNSGGVYITDKSSNTIYQLDQDLTVFEGGGDWDTNTGEIDLLIFDDDLSGTVSATEALSSPMGMHSEIRMNNGVASEYLYIADYGNDRIVTLLVTQSGEQVTKVYDDVTAIAMNNPIDVAVFDRQNVMYVLTENNQVHLFRRWDNNTDFDYRFSWTVPETAHAIDADQYGAVYVATEHAVYKYGFDEWAFWADGVNDDEKPIPLTLNGVLFGGSTAGSTDNDFNMPMGISAGLNGWDNTNKYFANGRLYISDMLNNRVKSLQE